MSERIAAAIENRGRGTEFDALAELLRDGDPPIREEAARSIEFHAQRSYPPGTPGWEDWFFREQSVETLLAGLSDDDPHVRRYLLRAYPILKFCDPADVLPRLEEGLDTEHAEMRIAALQAIQAVGKDLASGVVATIAALADDPVAQVRSADPSGRATRGVG